jgi:hypothetical protein
MIASNKTRAISKPFAVGHGELKVVLRGSTSEERAEATAVILHAASKEK